MDGLSDREVAERVAAGRVNRAPGGTSRSLAGIVRANVLTRFNAILGALLVVILTVGLIQDALRRRPGDQRRHRHLPGVAGQADPRPPHPRPRRW